MRRSTLLVLLSFTIVSPAAGEPAMHWISSGVNNRDLTISPRGDELFTSIMWPGNHFSVIVVSHKRDGQWQPLEVAPFSGSHPDIEPMFSPDGDALYFASRRPAHGKTGADWDIWVTRKTGNGWGEPERLPSPVNSGANEFYPSIAANGNLYFTVEREDGLGAEDIYRAIHTDGTYAEVENVGPGVNSSAWEFNAFVAPDEAYIIFSSQGRPNEVGGGDLYISYRDESGAFGSATLLPEGVNSVWLDYCPFVWNDQFYFTSRRVIEPGPISGYQQVDSSLNAPGNGMGDIYVVDLDEIMAGPPNDFVGSTQE